MCLKCRRNAWKECLRQWREEEYRVIQHRESLVGVGALYTMGSLADTKLISLEPSLYLVRNNDGVEICGVICDVP